MLDHRLIALQGLGVPLSPIAIAVQGLIAQIQEEARREEYHGGGGRQTSRQEPARPTSILARQELTEAEVRAQWELLELRQRNQAERTATAVPPAADAVTSPAVSAAAAAAQSLPAPPPASPEPRQPLEVLNQMQLDEEELALLLLLAEA